METIEEPRPFAESSLWPYMRAFYREKGPSNWRVGGIPFRSTTSPMVAMHYVRAVSSYFCDLERAGKLDPSEPVDIIELGIGSGALAMYFLLEWYGDGHPAHPQAIRYVATDIAEKNLEALVTLPAVKPFVDRGLLRTALFDAESPTPVSQAKSQVVLANYVFDSLPTRAFAWDRGFLFEWYISLQREGAGKEDADPLIARFQECEAVCSRIPIDRPHFADPLLDDAFAAQLAAGDATFTFPVSGLKMIAWLATHCPQLFILICDKGTRDGKMAPPDRSPLLQQHAGTYSTDVNFAVLNRYCAAQAGYAWISPTRHFPLLYCAQIYGSGLRPSVLEWTLHNCFERFSISDQQAITKAQMPDLSLRFEEVLGRLRLSGFDTYEYLNVIPILTSLELVQPRESVRLELVEALVEVVRRAHPAARALDIPRKAAWNLLKLGAFEASMTAYSRSLSENTIDMWRPLYGITYCLLNMGLKAEAKQTRALIETHPLTDQNRVERQELERVYGLLLGAAGGLI